MQSVNLGAPIGRRGRHESPEPADSVAFNPDFVETSLGKHPVPFRHPIDPVNRASGQAQIEREKTTRKVIPAPVRQDQLPTGLQDLSHPGKSVFGSAHVMEHVTGDNCIEFRGWR